MRQPIRNHVAAQNRRGRRIDLDTSSLSGFRPNGLQVVKKTIDFSAVDRMKRD